MNGVTVKGASGGASQTPAFDESGDSVVTKFEQVESGKWALTAFAELDNKAYGSDVTEEMIKVYAADSLEDLKSAEPLASGFEIAPRKCAVKATININTGTADKKFFKVTFGE